MKKIIWIDMDGVLVDLGENINKWLNSNQHHQFYRENPDTIPGIFRDPKPVEGAIDAVQKLDDSDLYDLRILTTSPWGNPESMVDKRYWIEKYFGDIFYKKITITHSKDLLVGDYLIDDRLANGAKDFKGELIRFGWDYENENWNEYPGWDNVLEKLID
jgi:5'(3')-deoxyribonucleotidase